MRYRMIFKCIVFAGMLSGCATSLDKATIYYDRPEFADQIVKQMPEILGPISQHGRCNVILATPGSNTGSMHFCIFAVTQDALLVLDWNAMSLEYTPIVKLKWSSINAVSLKTFGLTKQLQFIEKQRQMGFSAIIDDGGYIDREATMNVFNFAESKGVKVIESHGLMKAPQGGAVFVPIIINR